MNRFENTGLWQRTLGVQLDPDPEAKLRTDLRNAYEKFRERAALLAGEIARDLPDFTVHDISHIDALWEVADLIAGSDFPLTPTEAFVLGGAFLIHDLGMGLAAYPEGVAELRKEQLWGDSIAALLKQKLERTPTAEEIQSADTEIQKQATDRVLRELHAKHAERLALVSWRDRKDDSTQYHLIDDPELRLTYGPVIGKIAHSHWWSIEQVEQNFKQKLGARGGYANEWIVDPLKLACILRTADASHLDERRAPGFLRVVRKPFDFAGQHWTFQEKLYQPRLEVDRLVYTSKSPFTIDESSAWWLCYDALQVVDRELRQVNTLLADTNRTRLAAQGVSYVEEPKRLAKLIATGGWEPVDARIRVGDVASLIEKLGGEDLYGHDATVPLRELIQNAIDAIIARRLLENRPANWGDVYVRNGEDARGHWIEVEDTGIGMSGEVLTGPFLDFGTSFWGSNLMHTELPGLEAKGFSSIGKYGIGFFSVFMWGERVQVVTRRPERAHEDTLILEFDKGSKSRPLLRKAHVDEFLREGGTRVRVWLKDSEILERLFRHSPDSKSPMETLCTWLCPTIDANLWVESSGEVTRVIGASDWITMDGSDFIKRLLRVSSKQQAKMEVAISNLGKNLRVLKNSSNEVVGRACVLRTFRERSYLGGIGLESGIVTIGGLRANNLRGILGVLIGKPHTVSRDTGIPVVEHNVLKEWSSAQTQLVHNLVSDPKDMSACAEVIRWCSGDTGDLPIAINRDIWVSTNDISSRQDWPDEILLVDLNLAEKHDDNHFPLNFHENVFILEMSHSFTLSQRLKHLGIDWEIGWLDDTDLSELVDEWYLSPWIDSKSLVGAVLQAIAEAWKIPLKKVLEEIDPYRMVRQPLPEVGKRGDETMYLPATIIKKPKE